MSQQGLNSLLPVPSSPVHKPVEFCSDTHHDSSTATIESSFSGNFFGPEQSSQLKSSKIQSRSYQQFTLRRKGSQINYDRFIPQRNIRSNHRYPWEWLQQYQHQNNSQTNFLYRKYVLNQRTTQESFGIDSFQNNNFLHFGQSQSWQPQKKLLLNQLKSQVSRPRVRKINTNPLKVLQVPGLQDDYYLNLIDWSPYDIVSAGLGTSCYLWNPHTAQANRLCEMNIRNFVTSVGFAPQAPLLAIGTQSGVIEVWDLEKTAKIRSMTGHIDRVGSLAWNDGMFSSGSRDNYIMHRDLRIVAPFIAKLQGHSQQVCGLRWSPDQQQLCSGGNDNKVLIWSVGSNKPLYCYHDHNAAVKAVAWSPHQHGLFASGGGSTDRTIKFRSTLTGETLGSWETGSQVCNLIFSRSVNQLVSSHGYAQNEVAVWNCKHMNRVASLRGHKYRVVYLAMSPGGTTVVSGSGDETIRFWEVFPDSNRPYQNQNRLERTSTVLR